MKKYDVIIVGAGVIGSAAAYNLAKKNLDVLVLEKEEIGIGGSSRNGGGVRQSARKAEELPLAIYAVNNIWPNLEKELGVNIEYHQEGNLRLGKTEAHRQILADIVAQGQAQGLELELIKRDEIKKICPYISDEVQYASYCPTDGHANPMKTTLAYYKKALELGVKFITGEEVTSVLIKEGKIAGVKTKTDSYSSQKVILAAGYESKFIADSLGIEIPMRKLLVEVLVTEPRELMFDQMIGTAGSDFYGHQSEHGSFVFGGMTGNEPYQFDQKRRVTLKRTAPSISRAILNYFPLLKDLNVIRTWSGFLDQTPDHLPIISRVEEIDNFYLACGFSGHGFGIAPAVGELIADLAAEEDPALNLSSFKYDRFHPKS
ncbi:FAD-binding oxidoreductase [Halanaerobium sp. Z-7514]|uniref:FAD-binding oxidoreductase n=1 Tax=Halanaerobium polyolivorans TaxID=2886943 RepID=A0AAW4WYE3_9FIRM|nr:FAD-binding oxidoreductase [Halanaerobium polyolivorans]RQD76855.1 MAG: FAD-binding oxidoreductase [Halanaerobium sp. MSAO_Bac5]